MKTVEALKIAGIVFAGVAAYLAVTRAVKTGGAVVQAAVDVVTKDLNPASPENVVYKNLPESVQTKIGDFIGVVLNPFAYSRYKNNLSVVADTSKQSAAFIGPPISAINKPSFVNPFAGVSTMPDSQYTIPLNFGLKNNSGWMQ